MNSQETTSVIESNSGSATESQKIAYQKPALKTYGLVKHLTQGAGSLGGDGNSSKGLGL